MNRDLKSTATICYKSETTHKLYSRKPDL